MIHSLRGTIAQHWSHTDPEAALEWVIDYSGEDQELLESLRRSVFRNLVRVDFERALDISRNSTWSTLVNAQDAAEYDVLWELTQLGMIDGRDRISSTSTRTSKILSPSKTWVRSSYEPVTPSKQ